MILSVLAVTKCNLCEIFRCIVHLRGNDIRCLNQIKSGLKTSTNACIKYVPVDLFGRINHFVLLDNS
jgi:hypothetical protein